MSRGSFHIKLIELLFQIVFFLNITDNICSIHCILADKKKEQALLETTRVLSFSKNIFTVTTQPYKIITTGL